MDTARRKPGVIRDAIVAYLRRRDEATITEIHKGVEIALGGTVAPSSVRSYLRLNSGEIFKRTGHGRYRLANLS